MKSSDVQLYKYKCFRTICRLLGTTLRTKSPLLFGQSFDASGVAHYFKGNLDNVSEILLQCLTVRVISYT
jgi:hypothetical protein